MRPPRQRERERSCSADGWRILIVVFTYFEGALVTVGPRYEYVCLGDFSIFVHRLFERIFQFSGIR